MKKKIVPGAEKRRIVDLSKTKRRLDPDQVAAALGAEPCLSIPDLARSTWATGSKFLNRE